MQKKVKNILNIQIKNNKNVTKKFKKNNIYKYIIEKKFLKRKDFKICIIKVMKNI